MNNLKEKLVALEGLEAIAKHAYVITIGEYRIQMQGEFSEEAVTEVLNAGGQFDTTWINGGTEYHQYDCLVNGIIFDITLCK